MADHGGVRRRDIHFSGLAIAICQTAIGKSISKSDLDERPLLRCGEGVKDDRARVFQRAILNGGNVPTSLVGSPYCAGAYVLRFGLRSLGIGSSAAVMRSRSPSHSPSSHRSASISRCGLAPG